jgi:hypothetical protein
MAGPGRAVPDGTRSLTCRTKDIMVLTKRFKLGEEEDGYGSSPTANRVVMVQRSEECLFPGRERELRRYEAKFVQPCMFRSM